MTQIGSCWTDASRGCDEKRKVCHNILVTVWPLYRRKSRRGCDESQVALDDIQARIHSRDKLSQSNLSSQISPTTISHPATSILTDIPHRPRSRAVCCPSTAAQIAQLTYWTSGAWSERCHHHDSLSSVHSGVSSFCLPAAAASTSSAIPKWASWSTSTPTSTRFIRRRTIKQRWRSRDGDESCECAALPAERMEEMGAG